MVWTGLFPLLQPCTPWEIRAGELPLSSVEIMAVLACCIVLSGCTALQRIEDNQYMLRVDDFNLVLVISHYAAAS